jgi:hypothetical protein
MHARCNHCGNVWTPAYYLLHNGISKKCNICTLHIRRVDSIKLYKFGMHDMCKYKWTRDINSFYED